MTSTTLLRSRRGHSVGLCAAGVGEPVILIHGVGLQSVAWGPQIDALAHAHRVIALDLPGHGQSAPLPPGAELPDFVAWLFDVLATLDCGPVNIVGHSMGALIAGGFAVAHSEMTRRVALVNGVFCRDPLARRAVEARAAEIRAGNIDLEAPLTRWFSDSEGQSEARAQVAEWLRTVDPSGYATTYAAFAKGDATYADRFATIGCPFLALTADGDLNSTPAMSQAMAGMVRDGQAVTIDGHRHMVNLTAPDLVSSHLLTWLGRAPARKELS